VEEYVASGQPVGSKALVERAGMEVSSSTVRNELAELEALGLLTHPHTSAGRVPTDSGYRLYAEELVETLGSRPEKAPFEIAQMRNELEAALQSTTETLSQATRLLALVTAPALAAASVRHVDVLQLQPRTVIVVVITSTGDVRKRVFELEEPVDPGLVDWARTYLEEQVIGLALGSSVLRRRLEDSALPKPERTFLVRLRPAFVEALADDGPQLFVGGAAGLLGDARGTELETCHRLLEVLERRAAVLELLSDALDPHRTVVRVGPEVEGGQLHDVSYVGAMYGLASRPLGSVALLGPLRMDYEKAIRAVRAAAFELSRLVEDVYEDA
jgi:heat-inducible transcriptional repressor